MASKRLLFWFVCLVTFMAFLDVSPADAAKKRRRKARTTSVQRAWLESRSAIVVNAKTGEALFERRPDENMYPASTTKILTAIVAIESGRMDEIVTPLF